MKFNAPEETDLSVTHYVVADLEGTEVFRSNFRSACEDWADETGKIAVFKIYRWNGEDWQEFAGHSLAFD